MNKDSENLSKACDELFYDGDSDLKGNVGIKNLGSALSLSDEEFDIYMDNL